jgi:hypothetical protein
MRYENCSHGTAMRRSFPNFSSAPICDPASKHPLQRCRARRILEPVKVRLASAIRTPEARQHHRRPRHRGDPGRPFMPTAHTTGVHDGLQAGTPAQVIDMPGGARSFASMVKGWFPLLPASAAATGSGGVRHFTAWFRAPSSAE